MLEIPVQGGVLVLTNQELLLGEGILGTRNVRRFKLNSRTPRRSTISQRFNGAALPIRTLRLDEW